MPASNQRALLAPVCRWRSTGSTECTEYTRRWPRLTTSRPGPSSCGSSWRRGATSSSPPPSNPAKRGTSSSGCSLPGTAMQSELTLGYFEFLKPVFVFLRYFEFLKPVCYYEMLLRVWSQFVILGCAIWTLRDWFIFFRAVKSCYIEKKNS